MRNHRCTCVVALLVIALALLNCGAGNRSPDSLSANTLFIYTGDNSGSGISGYYFDTATSTLKAMPSSPFGSGSPAHMALHPNHKFIVGADAHTGLVSVFGIAADGSLVGVVNGTATAQGAAFPTFDPSGRFLYVSNTSSNTISAYSFDQTSGAITALPGSPFSVGQQPGGIVFSLDGTVAFVTALGKPSVAAFSVDPVTGSLSGSPISSAITGPDPGPVLLHPSGKYLYVGNQNLVPYGMGTVSAFEVNGGYMREISGSPFASAEGLLGVSMTRSGKYLFAVNCIANSISVFTIAADGTLAHVPGSPFHDGQIPGFATPDPSEKFVAVSRLSHTPGQIAMYAMDPNSGRLQLLSNAVAISTRSPNAVIVVQAAK